MGTEAPEMVGEKKPPPQALPLPPVLFVVRARSRVADQGGGAAAWPWTPDTPPRLSPVTVPFLWEEAPGKPKPQPPRPDDTSLSPAGAIREDVVAAASPTTTPAGGDHDTGGGVDEARPAPLKLPPRLQRVATAKYHDGSISPRTVLQGPYYGCAGGGGKRPPRRTASGGGLAAFRRMPSAGVGLFSRSKGTTAAAAGTNRNRGGGHHDNLSAAAPDAPWCSPASSSSSSSMSTSCFGDDHRRLADGRQDVSSEEDECARGSVRITRFRRNRSLPSMTTSHLWASIRKSVKQITPWN